MKGEAGPPSQSSSDKAPTPVATHAPPSPQTHPDCQCAAHATRLSSPLLHDRSIALHCCIIIFTRSRCNFSQHLHQLLHRPAPELHHPLPWPPSPLLPSSPPAPPWPASASLMPLLNAPPPMSPSRWGQ